MNLLDGQNEDYVPINPWITLASGIELCEGDKEDSNQAIPPTKKEGDAYDVTTIDNIEH